MDENFDVRSPFQKPRQAHPVSHDKGVIEVSQTQPDILQHVPLEVEDAYHFANTVMQIQHAVYNLPRSMTLARFRYLLAQMGTSYKISYLAALDPFGDITSQEQSEMLGLIDHDVFCQLNNILVHCMGLSGSSVEKLPLDPSNRIARFTDKFLTIKTIHGWFEITYRWYNPPSVPDEKTREMYHRQIASNNDVLSARAMLLVVDPMFPLCLVPGINTMDTLVNLSKGAPSLE